MKPFKTHLRPLSRAALSRITGTGIKPDKQPRCLRYECDLIVTCAPGCWCKPNFPDQPEGWCV
ncbi:hypothetical protein KTO58_08840 [Chitinophaga pendula]|uniref:hypothetical protein n=1 Tax=Chitinophaga TaxID=79328 RepID=UPI0012FE1CCB|nr:MULTISPECIES: hypothetical protein [Chitinophaga]UCJ09274.1 hypothetical protein KTO58_08840 [Chitinophaga pendula]